MTGMVRQVRVIYVLDSLATVFTCTEIDAYCAALECETRKLLPLRSFDCGVDVVVHSVSNPIYWYHCGRQNQASNPCLAEDGMQDLVASHNPC